MIFERLHLPFGVVAVQLGGDTRDHHEARDLRPLFSQRRLASNYLHRMTDLVEDFLLARVQFRKFGLGLRTQQAEAPWLVHPMVWSVDGTSQCALDRIGRRCAFVLHH